LAVNFDTGFGPCYAQPLLRCRNRGARGYGRNLAPELRGVLADGPTMNAKGVGGGAGRGNKKSADHGGFSMADAENLTGISHQQVSKWRRRSLFLDGFGFREVGHQPEPRYEETAEMPILFSLNEIGWFGGWRVER
jgi:hypothetical protein